jgi:uncharacterized protein (DUF3084 family)
MSTATISVDEFMALEQKVLQTVELIKKERDARATAEAGRSEAEAAKAAVEAELTTAREEASHAKAELSVTQQELSAAQQEIGILKQDLDANGDVQSEVVALQQERETVRLRVEKMLAHLDELL